MAPGIRCSFLKGLKLWRNATNFEKRHRTLLEGFYFVVWHNRKFFLVLPEKWCHLYVPTRTSCKKYKSFRALSEPSASVFAYSANAMVDVDDEVRINRMREVFLQAALADYCFTVIM